MQGGGPVAKPEHVRAIICGTFETCAQGRPGKECRVRCPAAITPIYNKQVILIIHRIL